MKLNVLILTKSAKHHNYCVAGINCNTGELVRLVTDNEETKGAIPKNQMWYADGTPCMPLDLVEVSCIGLYPSAHQPENILVTGDRFRKIKSIDIDDLMDRYYTRSNLNNIENLFLNSKNYLFENQMDRVTTSLILAEVADLKLFTVENNDKKKTKARLIYRGKTYDKLSVTDQEYFDIDGEKKIERALVVMSLPAEPYEEIFYFKYIAKIFELGPDKAEF